MFTGTMGEINRQWGAQRKLLIMGSRVRVPPRSPSNRLTFHLIQSRSDVARLVLSTNKRGCLQNPRSASVPSVAETCRCVPFATCALWHRWLLSHQHAVKRARPSPTGPRPPARLRMSGYISTPDCGHPGPFELLRLGAKSRMSVSGQTRWGSIALFLKRPR